VNSDRTNNRLRVWRTDHGLSVRDVADLTGFDVSTISRVERGQRCLAPLTKVVLARRLGVAVADLFDVDPTEVAQP
jgi:transcriptional regulator with XRE-family HTH domain